MFGITSPPAWMEFALCAQTDPEMHFPEQGGSTMQAKSVCRRCPVLASCREWIMRTEDPGYRHGVAGGLSVPERKKLYRQQQEAAA